MLCLVAARPLMGETYSKQFVVPQTIPNASVNPIAVGDVNGDGRPDIVYATTVLLQNANGTFRSVSTGQTFSAAAKLADVNGDGKLDVVDAVPGNEYCDQYPDGTPYCYMGSDPSLYIYLGKGDGTFTISPNSLDLGQSGSGTATLAVLDVNGDKHPDATVYFSGIAGDPNSSASFVFLNDGAGKLQAHPSWLPPVRGFGDFNGDGHTDLFVDGAGVVFGDGHGNFTQGPQLVNIAAPVAVADFDRDGNLDIAGSGGIAYGNGKGQFTVKSLAMTFPAQTLIADDVNHDGYPDLIAGYVSLAVYTNLKNRSFSNPQVYAGQIAAGGVPPTSFLAADFNRDGYTDLLQGNLLFLGQKSNEYPAPIETLSTYAGTVAAADLNHDGIADVAVTNSSYQTVSVFTGTDKGYFNPGVKYATGINSGVVAIGDVNGDGVPDLVITRSSLRNLYPSPAKGATDLAVLLGNPDGTFRPAMKSATLSPIGAYTLNEQTYLVDVNHDGKLDLIGDWGVSLGNGDGTFQKPTPFPAPIQNIVGIGVGDFNRDGNVDIVVGEFGYGGYKQASSPTIYTLLGDGSGKFTVCQQETLPGSGTTLSALTVEDMDDDGKPDLVYVYSPGNSASTPSQVAIQLGAGDGTFRQATTTPVNSVASSYASLLIGDFNRDGHKDVVLLTLIVFNGTNNDSAYLAGDGAGNLEAPQYFPVQSYNGAVINVNGDAAPDFIATGVDGLGFQRVLNTGAH